MSFIAADEYIILMDHATLSLDDLKRVREIGVRTLYSYINWAAIEPAPGVYNWQAVSAQLERARAADMKLLLRCYEQAPAWFPADWYLRTADGVIWRELPGWGGPTGYTLLSPWCAEAMAEEQAFMQMCQELYASPTVQLYAGVAHDGELLLPGMVASYYDPHAVASFRAFTGRDDALPADLPVRSGLFDQTQLSTLAWLDASLAAYVTAQQAGFPEIWLSLVERAEPTAPETFCGPASGNWLRRKLCDHLPATLGKPLNLLLFEIYRPVGTEGMLDSIHGYEGCTWVGSQYCDGLRAHTADAIGRGLRGFITAPVHDARPGTLEPWMLEAFTWSLTQWREAAKIEEAA
jgi:hypothetical protein